MKATTRLLNTMMLLSTLLIPTLHAVAGEDRPVLPEYVYTPSTNPMLQATNTLATAKADNKYALIVLGSQWCHDSVGLAQQFSTPQMQAILSDRFATQFIDVAYLEDRRDITNLVGYPNYFATPTVLIVDPTTNTVMNTDTLTIWQSADSVELDTYIEEFSKWNKNDSGNQQSTAVQAKPANAALAAFEKQQSERLQQGYQLLGPMLAASDNPDNDKVSEDDRKRFFALWKEVKTFRTDVQRDIHELRRADLKQNDIAQKLLEATPKLQSWENAAPRT